MVDGRIAARRAEVRAARRRARLRRTLLVATLLAGLGAGGWFLQSEHARVRDVTVTGTVRLAPDEVVAASGVRRGAPTVWLWPPRIARAVEALPLVATAEVRRRSLVEVAVVVEERRAVYAATHAGTTVLVDRTGLVIDAGTDPRLPTVRLATPPPDPGGLVAAHAALANAHRVWTGLSGPLRSRVVALRAPDEDGLALELADGPVLLFGRAEQLEQKVRAAGAVLADVAGSPVTLVDVRVPDVPVVRID